MTAVVSLPSTTGQLTSNGNFAALLMRCAEEVACRPFATEIAFRSLRAARTTLYTSSRDRGCEIPSPSGIELGMNIVDPDRFRPWC